MMNVMRRVLPRADRFVYISIFVDSRFFRSDVRFFRDRNTCFAQVQMLFISVLHYIDNS